MKNLYLIRHGETELNITKVYYGSTDCALTQKGREQSRGLAPIFKDIQVDAVYTSPLIRAKDTAEIIFGCHHSLVIDTRLKEMDFGQWEGKHYTDLAGDEGFELWQREWKTTPAPGGESFNDLTRRVEEFWQRLKTRPEDNVAIVGHNAVLMLLLPTILSLTPEQGWHFCFEQGRYSHIAFADDFPVIKFLNR